MSNSPDGVCVIIVNFNAGAYLGRCLDALDAQTRRPERVLLVDNASRDGSADGLETAYPWLEVVRMAHNLGFAAANNLAVQRAEGLRWVALLNPDAFPEPDWLERLLEAAAEHPECRFFGSRLLDAQEPEVLDGNGDVYHVSGGTWRRGHGVSVARSGLPAGEPFSPCAAAALYDRAAFLEVGGFDERYFCYIEDIDLGFRLRLAGHRARQVDTSLVHHMGSGVTGALSDFSLYHVQRNLVWTFFKNMPFTLLLRYLPQHLLFNLLGVAALARRGKGRVVLRAKWDALRGLPAIWRSRRKERVESAELLRVMERGWLTPYRRDKALQK